MNSLLIKKFFLSISFAVVTGTVNIQATPVIIQPVTQQNIQANNAVVLSSLGLLCIIKGIFDYYDIPLLWQDNLVMASRSQMSADDLPKHKLGNKIKTYAELVGGAFLFVLGSLSLGIAVTNQPAQAVQ